jgi:hypothetical protein
MKQEKPANSWNHAAESRWGQLNKSAAKGRGMLAKPDCDGVSAAAGFSMRTNMQRTNRFQTLKKEAIGT